MYLSLSSAITALNATGLIGAAHGAAFAAVQTGTVPAATSALLGEGSAPRVPVTSRLGGSGIYTRPPWPGSDMFVHGEGEIGDKARQLQVKTPALRQLGFRVPTRHVLAEGFFDDVFATSGLGARLQAVTVTEETAAEVVARIQQASLSERQQRRLERILAEFGTVPLAIRSSAKGDARGTGIYESRYTSPHPEAVMQTVLRVLASYFSQNALAFRRVAQTQEGFGIIIEPLLGQDYPERVYGKRAPLLSGYGYTSTPKGPGVLRFEPGLSGGVATRQSDLVGRGDLEDGLQKFVIRRLVDILTDPSSRLRSTADRGIPGLFQRPPRGRAFLHNPSGQESRFLDSFGFSGDAEDEILGLDLLPLFDRMPEMERRFGRRQYFEWVVTKEEGETVFWITQIADVNSENTFVNVKNVRNVLLTANHVVGSGRRTAKEIFYLYDWAGIAALREFNKIHRGYLLIVPSSITTTAMRALGNIEFSDFSNASALVELVGFDYKHNTDPAGHFGGQLEEARILFAILDTLTSAPDSKTRILPYLLQTLKPYERAQANDQDDGFFIYDFPSQILVDPTEDILVVAALPK